MGRADSARIQRRLCLGEQHLAFSSWRYNLPVDWIVYFYFGIGAIEILSWVASLFGAKVSDPNAFLTQCNCVKERKSNYAILVAAFVLIGSLPWLAEGIAQPRYTSTPEELKAQVVLQDPRVEEFLSQPDSLILEGRLLYPRFFRRNDGIFSTTRDRRSTPCAIFAARICRAERQRRRVIFPADSPIKLTHGADVIVLGCQRDKYIEARWLFFPALNETYETEIPERSMSSINKIRFSSKLLN
ncbi:MAG: hypothetical protein U0V48_01870 [Anaerolineales bacterium]